MSTSTKRIRWATQHKPGAAGAQKRENILRAFSRRRKSEKEQPGAEESQSKTGADAPAGLAEGEQTSNRQIYINQPLPPELLDEDGHPNQYFARNKIRTAKYTPVSFVPKNLWLQFHNVANVYFLFIVILSIFSIFGASNAGIGSLPLIFILVVTAIKDATEDYRRATLDDELNNTPVHILADWINVNVENDEIGLWRNFKKSTSRSMRALVAGTKALFKRRQVPADGDDADPGALQRYRTRASVYSFQSARDEEESFQMTPVSSPSPNSQRPTDNDIAPTEVNGTGSAGDRTSKTPRFYGSIMDPFMETPGTARFKRGYWKNVRVGDILRIYNDEPIPADVLILSTSDADGACYIETKNLDGETNLKIRHALRSGKGIKHAKDCERVTMHIESEEPHANLYQYSGIATWMQKDKLSPEKQGTQMSEPININNILLRGCSLKNTDWAIGVVVFTGDETKIMMNAGITPSKRSRISRELNWNVITNFIILFIMCLVSGIVQGTTWAKSGESSDYFEYGSIGGTPPVDGIVTFWTAVILFQNLVPISLYISIELIKLAQAFFIFSDVDMYYDKIDYPCTPKSWNISDDLGQIEYIFSDKTGTLTQNVMEFKKCTINGIPYGEAYTEAQAGMQKRQGINVEEEGARQRNAIAESRKQMLKELREIHDNPYLDDGQLTFVAPHFVSDLRGQGGEDQARRNAHFMLVLALCHSVLPEQVSDDPPRIDFKAQSPDESALVATARDVGFALVERTQEGVVLEVQGERKEYEVLQTLEFNSTRKRMSAIVRMPETGKIMLFCKGADSMIYSRLKKGDQPKLRTDTAEHLELFAQEGLRTLCVAEKEIDEEVYRRWNEEHEKASSALTNREEKMEELADSIERDLTLLGGTAIEDRLQDGVPDTIALLAVGGIKLWVLTGDKVETAINIGFSCNLLENSMDLIVFKVEDDSRATAEAQLDRYLQEYFQLTYSEETLAAAKKDHNPPAATHALVVDGDALKHVLEDDLKMKFLLLCKNCKAVLCCRVSPSQKAAVVQMVKKGLDVMTLSIGDGANDVAMIQEADVGVGIAGEEGRQAVMSSDYAIGQFRFLGRLVLVHGRWSYRRIAEMIANFFYKNIVWTIALFWYQLYNNFDGTYLYEYTYILFYNLFFTSLPVILMGILDQDVDDKVSLAVPQLYRRGILRKEWTQLKFWVYMIDGWYQSVICFFFAYLLFRPGLFITASGRDVGSREQMGVFVATSAVIIVNLYILINQYRWDWLFLLIVALSSLLIFFWTGVYSQFTSTGIFYKAASQVYGTLNFWAVVLLTVTAALLPRFASKVAQKLFFPRDIDIIREQVRQGRFSHLHQAPEAVSTASSSSSQSVKPHPPPTGTFSSEEERPFYPPSVAPTAATSYKRGSGNGSDGTDYLPHRFSIERPRQSFERIRASMERPRPSFEASHDFTSAAMLARMESSHSVPSRLNSNLVREQ